MWQWALEFSRRRKASRAAFATISPLVERSRRRLGGISDATWSDPYIVGFLAMLISIVAKLESRAMSANAMRAVQCRAWAEITAETSETMAEQLLLLSEERDRNFELGCHNAAALSAVLFGAEQFQEGTGVAATGHLQEFSEGEPTTSYVQRENVDAAWIRYFDGHIVLHARSVECEK